MFARVITPKRKTTPAVKATRADGRPVSELSQHGDAAKLAAETALLRAALEANDWNATKAGASLGINALPTVLRQIERCGLRAEYENRGR